MNLTFEQFCDVFYEENYIEVRELGLHLEPDFDEEKWLECKYDEWLDYQKTPCSSGELEHFATNE